MDYSMPQGDVPKEKKVLGEQPKTKKKPVKPETFEQEKAPESSSKPNDKPETSAKEKSPEAPKDADKNKDEKKSE